MMIDMSNPIMILVALVYAVVLIFLGVEVKRSISPAIGLFTFIALLVLHAVQLALNPEIANVFLKGISMDFIFIFLLYISYLWVDDIETKDRNKESIDGSLDWFWKKV